VRNLLVSLCLSAAAAMTLAGTPDAGDFQVNAYTPGSQWLPSVGADEAGNFVVVWSSSSSAGGDGSGYSIQGRRFDSGGDPLGGDFQVNTYTPGDQMFPAVAVDADGDFVVVWQSVGSAGTDTAFTSVQGRRFSSGGQPQGDDFQVNAYTPGLQGYPRVSASPAGDFVVVWHSDGSSGFDDSGYSIQGRRFASDGTALAAEFQVNSYSAYDQDFADVAVAADGGFVVVWHSRGSFGDDNPGSSVQAQVYDSAGAPQGDQLQVNAYTTGNQRSPAVGAAADGSFVVTWASYGSTASDASGYSVQARRFDSGGAALGAELQVNTYTTSGQDVPRIAVAGDGGFAVVWESVGSPGDDASDRSVQGRCYTPAGSALGDQLQVNTYVASSQFLPAVAVAASGSLTVAWTSFGSSGDDGSALSVQARLLDPARALFLDGFESGDTGGWSSASP
jgi:hypothetical protein